MSLALDARQRAMLEEMGIQLFWPAPPAQESPAAAAVAAPVARSPVVAPSAPVPQPLPAPARAPVAPVTVREHDTGGLPLFQWDPQRGHAPIAEGATVQAGWLVVTDTVGTDPELIAQAGKLLDNMLVGLGLTRQDHVVVAQAGAEAGVAAIVAQLRPRLLLVMGRLAAQAALQTSEPLGRLRGRVHDCGGVPAVVTYPPAYLLRNGADKAKAWSDLCLARTVVK